MQIYPINSRPVGTYKEEQKARQKTNILNMYIHTVTSNFFLKCTIIMLVISSEPFVKCFEAGE